MPFVLNPDDELTIKLTAAELNVILDLLSGAQYRLVATIVAKLTEQAQAHAAKTPGSGFATGGPGPQLVS